MPKNDTETLLQSENTPLLPCIGIDIGTTTISVIVLDAANGNTAAVHNIASASDIPSEKPWEKKQNAELIIEKILEILTFLYNSYPGIRAIGLTGQMHGILYTDSDGNELLLGDVLGSDADEVQKGIEAEEERIMIYRAIEKLNEREKEIIVKRFGLYGRKELTQKELADSMGISQSYISRLEKKIINQMRKDIIKETGII